MKLLYSFEDTKFLSLFEQLKFKRYIKIEKKNDIYNIYNKDHFTDGEMILLIEELLDSHQKIEDITVITYLDSYKKFFEDTLKHKEKVSISIENYEVELLGQKFDHKDKIIFFRQRRKYLDLLDEKTLQEDLSDEEFEDKVLTFCVWNQEDLDETGLEGLFKKFREWEKN